MFNSDMLLSEMLIKRMKDDALLVCHYCKGEHPSYQSVREDGYHRINSDITDLKILPWQNCLAISIYLEIIKMENK